MKITELDSPTKLIESYIAYELDKKSRERLLKAFPPKYNDFVGDHITYQFGVSANTKLPKNSNNINVVGYVDNGKSIEALIVAINGTTIRKDGKTYHITWSLDRSKGKKPVHSNNLITLLGWKRIKPIQILAKVKLL